MRLSDTPNREFLAAHARAAVSILRKEDQRAVSGSVMGSACGGSTTPRAGRCSHERRLFRSMGRIRNPFWGRGAVIPEG
jgi:hypothetical protein